MRFYGQICDVKRFLRENAGLILFCVVLSLFSIGVSVAAGVKLECPNDYFEQKGGVLIVWVRGDCGAAKYAILSLIESATVFAFMWICAYCDFTSIIGFASVFYRGYTRGFSLAVIAAACGIKSLLLVVIDTVFLIVGLVPVAVCAIYILRCDQRLRDGISCVSELTRTVLILFSVYVCAICLETVVLSALISLLF